MANSRALRQLQRVAPAREFDLAEETPEKKKKQLDVQKALAAAGLGNIKRNKRKNFEKKE